MENAQVDHAERSLDRAIATVHGIKQSFAMTKKATKHKHTRLPPPNPARLASSLTDSSYDDLHEYVEQAKSKRETVLYLAYGSNLSNETFRGRRGIKPLSQINVQVPSLKVTFDLPGIPYAEPCFANSGRRDPEKDMPEARQWKSQEDEKTPLLAQSASNDEFRKDEWHKGLIGVVYECTPEDYAHIIETEGGGSSYQDILVDCYPLPLGDPAAPVPQNPTSKPFRAHTLFAPAVPPGEAPPKDGGRFQRPDTSYAQASARYLKLITDGAAELELPYEYQDHVRSLTPYTITSNKQRLGQFILLALWGPIVFSLFAMGKVFADERGRIPPWLRELMASTFKAVWASYDSFFKPTFGDGERTMKGKIDGIEDNPRETIRSDNLGPALLRESEKSAYAEGVV